MTTKKDISKLLSKGLTGKEAGRLILEDNWLVDHMREGFLSPRDVSAIKAGLKTTKDIEDYNSYVETYRIIDYTLKDAHIKALELQIKLGAIIQLISMYVYGYTSEIDKALTPIIMTEKEYQDHKADQRKELLKELNSLDEVMLSRAYEITPEKTKDQEPEDEYFLAWLKRDHPDIWKKIVSDILDLLRTGKLRPALITGKDKEALTDLWDRIKELRERQSIYKMSSEELLKRTRDGSYPTEEDRILDIETKKLNEKEEALLQSLYKAGKGKSQDKLISSLEKILEGSMSQEEEDEILLYAFCSGEDLYQTGLPEQVKWIDEYKPGYSATEDGEDMLRGVAILKDPSPSELDNKGHYQKRYSRLEFAKKINSIDLDLRGSIKMAKEMIKLVLSFQSVFEAVSEVIGLDFTGDIKGWIGDIQNTVTEYNRLRQRILLTDSIPEEIKGALEPISLEKLTPYAKTTKYLRERVAMSLGEGWWEDVKGILLDDLREKEAQDG